MFFSGLDFNSESAIRAPAKSFVAGHDHACRQVGFRPVDRVLAVDDFSSVRLALRRGAQDQGESNRGQENRIGDRFIFHLRTADDRIVLPLEQGSLLPDQLRLISRERAVAAHQRTVLGLR